MKVLDRLGLWRSLNLMKYQLRTLYVLLTHLVWEFSPDPSHLIIVYAYIEYVADKCFAEVATCVLLSIKL